MIARDLIATTCFTTAVVIGACLLCSVDGAGAANSDASRVVGTLGSERVLDSDIVQTHQEEFDHLKHQRDLQLHQVELSYQRSYHELLSKDLDKMLDQRALEMEAADRGMKPEALLADIKAPVVTDEEARAFYEAHKQNVAQSFEDVATPLKQYLANEHNEVASRAFFDELRQKHGIRSTLPPYRLKVAATGPVRGNSDAPVTIVEFADFQCPYCRQAESILKSLMRNHPDDVRVVFRNFPLTELHRNAAVAASAAVCADLQGKFWEMHDAMFSNQTALSADALTDTAGRLGLDRRRFSDCLSDQKHTAAILLKDVEAGDELGVTSTPYFFIDGRPLEGSLPEEQFEKIIDQELSDAGKKRG